MTIETLFLQPLCITLALIGIGLVIIELRTDFDKSFLLFGIFLILLSAFCAPDLWNMAKDTGSRWVILQHVLACFMCPVIYQYLHYFCRNNLPRNFPLFYLVSTVLTVFFISGIMMHESKSVVSPAIPYFLTFVPFFFISIILNLKVLFSQIKICGNENALVFRMHLWGLLFLVLCGCLDIMQFVQSKLIIPWVNSFTIFGTIGVGVILAYLFTERIIIIIRERSTYIAKLKDSYRELEQAKSLSEIGKSTAIINHEIKNYASLLIGYTELLMHYSHFEEGKEKECIDIISETAKRICNFSKEVLEFSRAKIIADSRPLAIPQLINKCIKVHFSSKQNVFRVNAEDESISIYGDWAKLEHAFVNLFQNSLEAEAQNITVKFTLSESVLLITIEDDGVGVSADDMPKLFQAFHSKKRNGTGLGMTTSRSIIEGHGGYISVISKNLITNNEQHGLIFHISFPVYEENSENTTNDDIVLIEEGLTQLQSVLQTMRNVRANPYVINKVEEFKNAKFSHKVKVIGSPSAISKIPVQNYQCYSLIPLQGGLSHFVGGPLDRREGVFSEEFILSLLKTVA